MRLSKKILDKILTDNQFSLKLALLLNIKQQSVEINARRYVNGSNVNSLQTYQVISFYMQNGFTEDEIFEKDGDI